MPILALATWQILKSYEVRWFKGKLCGILLDIKITIFLYNYQKSNRKLCPEKTSLQHALLDQEPDLIWEGEEESLEMST